MAIAVHMQVHTKCMCMYAWTHTRAGFFLGSWSCMMRIRSSRVNKFLLIPPSRAAFSLDSCHAGPLVSLSKPRLTTPPFPRRLNTDYICVCAVCECVKVQNVIRHTSSCSPMGVISFRKTSGNTRMMLRFYQLHTFSCNMQINRWDMSPLFFDEALSLDNM